MPLDTLDMLEEAIVSITPSQASRLARHYLSLAQVFREIAGEPAIETKSQQRAKHGDRPAISVKRDRY